ncbi:hypothetical protein Tco_1016881 [Tanacetum coccineum]|uniref:Integrase, catalytic region, zinc finger, CCHC-type, peptidase aspartic, catalytic n=1 Tax=Tanacetum coccineum TaxID=301880 RepID=A0ABQ5FQ11_9ASTR
MTTLAEHIIVDGAENSPLMLEKLMYDSWASCIRLFIKGKKNGRMMLDSIDNDDYDVQATNIILYGLPPDVYELVNHQEAAKDIWDRVKLLMKDTELSYQERKCRLYNLVDKFAYVQGETLYEYYWRFSQLINDTHTIGMTMQQVQVNTRFPNALLPEWSKFVTDVKLAKMTLKSQAEFPQLDPSLVVPTFQQGDDLIECINKEMAFLFAMASRFPPSNNQLKTSSNHKNQATIQDERGNHAAGQAKEKLMLAETQEAGQILDEKQLAFIADPGITAVQVARQTIPHNLAFQTEDLDAYD